MASCRLMHPNFILQPQMVEILLVDAEDCSSFSSPSTSREDSIEKEKEKVRIPPQMCVVCLGPAKGHHYDVASCNGCRSFFRRTLVDQRTYKCKKSGKCELVKGHWRCRACRFQACVDVGMNPLAIESENLTENPMVKELSKRRIQEENLEMPDVKTVRPIIACPDEELSRRFGALLLVESKVNFLRRSTFTIKDQVVEHLQSALKRHSALGKVDKFEIVTNWEMFPGKPKQRNPGMRMDWFVEANKILDFSRRNWLFFDLVVAMEYAKTFDFFHKLNDDDKKALLRGVGLLCANVTQVFDSFANASDKIVMPDGDKIVKTLRERGPVIAERLENLGLFPILRLRPTTSEYVLLKAIMLCHAACPDLSDEGRELVQKEQNEYGKALLEYCRREYGDAAGALRFANIINVVDGFVRLAQCHKEWHVLFKAMHSADERARFIPKHTLIDDLMD